MAHVARQLIVLSLALAALAAVGCSRDADAPAFTAIDITGADYARGFDLPDADGRRRTLAEFAGKVVVVFFGFTNCPDVCPTTLAELAEVRRRLGADGARVQPVFVTVDPARDTPELLKAYAANFGADVVALRGSDDEIKATAQHFRVFYAQVPNAETGRYTVDHTAGSYVFDPQGRVRLFTRHGTGADALQRDLKLLLDGR